MRAQRAIRRAPRERAFTIVEVLATLTLAAIILPVVVHGILLCLATASYARQQVQAASLAQSKLDEIVATGEFYDTEMTGDFGEELPEYTWEAVVGEWDEDASLTQIDVGVFWTRRGQEHEVILTTLAYTGTPDD